MGNTELQTIHNLIEGLHQKIATLTTLVRKLDPNYKKPGRPVPVFASVVDERPTAEELCADGAMSLVDAAAFTGFCDKRIREAIHRNELVSIRNGIKHVIPRRALILWLARQVENGGAKL